MPGVAKLRATTDAGNNAWLAKNVAYPAMSIVTPGASTAISAESVAGQPRVRLAANEAGYALERTKPEYYLAERVEPPDNVNWTATYNRFLANGTTGFLFDPNGEAVYVAQGGTLRMTWVLNNGQTVDMTYIASSACQGRPRRIYWTDDPFNAPAIDLSGKFVKFFGPDELLKPNYGQQDIVAGGVSQTITNKITSGLVLDPTTHMLYAYGKLQGQVIMAYYDTGTFERLLHVQTVEVCRPVVNIMTGKIGSPLKADGRGYDTAGLRARPTFVEPTDNRGEYLYQHKGQYSYSPKTGNVYPLRPTKDCRWNAQIYWMETDEMEVEWPFELDHYECDWPSDATVFVRGGATAPGRDIYIPTEYSATLMDYQEPEGHARAPLTDGTFTTVGEGYSLLRLTADDNIWFVPIHSILRTNTDYFTLEPEEIAVGQELRLRGGSVAGTAANFSPTCDPDSPGYIYEAASDTIWNPNIYREPQPEGTGASMTNTVDAASSSDTNTYASVIYPVSVKSPSATVNSSLIEVWWNTTIEQEDMPKALSIPTLPQVYAVRWPNAGERPKIVIASQKGSGSESIYSHNDALYLSSTNSYANLANRAYFGTTGGTVMFWMWGEGAPDSQEHALLSMIGEETSLVFDWRSPQAGTTNLVVSVGGAQKAAVPLGTTGWHHVALTVDNVKNADTARLYIDGALAASFSGASALLDADLTGYIGANGSIKARSGVDIGEIVMMNSALTAEEIAVERYKAHDGTEYGLTGCYAFYDGIDLNVTSSDTRTFTGKTLGITYTAYDCLRELNGPPALSTGVIDADSDKTPKIYVQNDPAAIGYNPNEEHAFIQAGAGGFVAWAMRSDLNTAETSRPGVLVEYVKNGRKAMQWFDVALTNSVYPRLEAPCVAGKAIPGPHPLDFFDDPWKPETYWEEASATSPAHRDRKGQLWAKSAGDLHVHMYYPMQEGFAFPSLATNRWPVVGTSLPWLSLVDPDVPAANVLSAKPAAWLWRVSWPEVVPEIEIGRTLTVAASGLPEVWNAKSVGVLWPATDAGRDATAVLFDPTVAQTSGFPKTTYDTVAVAIADLGIKQGAGGNATLRKGRWTFDGLPPSLSSRFYLDTTADVTQCLKLVGEKEDNAGGVSLLHVNVLNAAERDVLKTLVDDTASESGKAAWRTAIDALATSCVKPSPHRALSDQEDIIDYEPRDHYALFTMGATNYVTIIQNDATNELLNVAAGDPIQMHVIKVVPKYYTGRVVTREDPLNLLSQQLSVIYEEAFAGNPNDYIFEWKKCSPHNDGSVPTDFEDEYTASFAPTNGLTRFVIGGQGDTLANMVNTYYAMRYRAASENSPAYAAMGDAWSEWTNPPALAEGWLQRVLNNVTPFAQRMRDLVDNEAETAVSMIRQAGAPYEGDVALSQDNLTSVGLIQLYETLLNKAESMSLQLGINDANANKQLQLAVARLADLYNVLGDEAYTDALNPTIGFGANFNTVEKTGFELDYGALSSTLFCFDNQVPTLLDEELALLRGRTGENAPVTRLSPYYNRLVWNFTRGMTAGEVAYAVNYDISGNHKGVIDYSQAAEMYPQGHGDAYGHYLSALSGYYRLLRNPNFSWGEPAMGEMVVADSVVNVDYYDEAQFSKAAYNVAKVALEAVDRTARKAYRDNGGATGAGYLDSDEGRNFGYGEWAARGGFGALCNWAVGNSILKEEPHSSRYYRYAFNGDTSNISATIADADAPELDRNGTWTVEFQFVQGEQADAAGQMLVALGNEEKAFLFGISPENKLSFSAANMVAKKTEYNVWCFSYTNAVEGSKFISRLSATNDTTILECSFYCDGNAPTEFPEGYDVNSQLSADAAPTAPQWDGWFCTSPLNEAGAYVAYTSGRTSTDYNMDEDAMTEEEIVAVEPGANYLVALRSSGGNPVVSVFNSAGALIANKEVALFGDVTVNWAMLGLDYTGEIGELRVWEDVRRSNEQLIAKREYVSPISDGLALYLRTISRIGWELQLNDEVAQTILWDVKGGDWLTEKESGMSIDFTDEGLKRIDRSTVAELDSLAGIVPQIQRKVDQMDAGLNPLGLAAGAIPFDLTPIGEGDDAKTHFEQIRERAGTALANARKLLDKAQERAGRMRMLYESQLEEEEMLSSAELEFKNRLIEYFGYPYEGDIGSAGSYPQDYDGPDILHYAWMEPAQFGLGAAEDIKSVTTNIYVRDTASFRDGLAVLLPNMDKTNSFMTITYEKSATGIILKPSNITGKRRACGQIQEKLGELLVAYRNFKGALSRWEAANEVFEYQVGRVRRDAVFHTVEQALSAARTAYETIAAIEESALKIGINSVESIMKMSEETQDLILDAVPSIVGAGMTVNTDPSAMTAAAIGPAKVASSLSLQGTLLAAKNALVATDAIGIGFDIAEEVLDITTSYIDTYDGYYDQVYDAAMDVLSEARGCRSAYVELLSAECAVETVVAEAERVIDERTLKRQQSVDLLTKTRYNEMFFRIARNEALSRYSAAFDLAQKYAYLAAQAYDYETGLLSSDKASGDKFMARITGTRTLGEFDGDGEPICATDAAKGDGGLAGILAELDANWLVLKPRLGINNPQQYATWFSLRHDLFRIYDGEDGDKAWKTKLRTFVVDDLNDVPEFRHYCQPLSGSTVAKEPGLVIPFPSVIAHGYNFFGEELAGGDAFFDSTYFATHIASAGVHFDGFDDSVLSTTPTVYLVPVGEDRVRAVGDPDTVLSWKVVDQTIPAPYAIGSTQLDDPDWTPLYDGATGGNDMGARIRKHPSFRAYYGAKGESPKDDELDCSRLVGRSAWNTRWLLIIPAGSMGADRYAALSAFVNGVDSDRDGDIDFAGVADIKLGIKTYSTSGN